jgi:hypothetical protein
MSKGRMSHHWDLFTPLICFVANPNLSRRYQLRFNQVHPFRRKKMRSISDEEFRNILYHKDSENEIYEK